MQSRGGDGRIIAVRESGDWLIMARMGRKEKIGSSIRWSDRIFSSLCLTFNGTISIVVEIITQEKMTVKTGKE